MISNILVFFFRFVPVLLYSLLYVDGMENIRHRGNIKPEGYGYSIDVDKS